MINKQRLEDQQVAFQIINTSRVNVGIVRLVESDGFWIESQQLGDELRADLARGPAIQTIQNPVIFVPTSSLMFLVASKD
jgi:hypothetical protein